jgi:hypothetical protein
MLAIMLGQIGDETGVGHRPFDAAFLFYRQVERQHISEWEGTTSGFNRTVTVGYIPHGSLSVPSGKIFHVTAKVAGPNGTFVNVPNACRT